MGLAFPPNAPTSLVLSLSKGTRLGLPLRAGFDKLSLSGFRDSGEEA